MSKIQSVQPNYQLSSKVNLKQLNATQNPSFSGVASDAAKALTKNQELIIDKAINNGYLGVKGKFLNFLSSTAGEAQNLWVMNIGTALIAPLLIANNPMSKEDKKTKEYTAWRQPISAVISLATGLGINIPAALYMDRKAAEGAFEKFDLSVDPPKAFLKKRYNNIKKNFANMKPADKKYFDMVNNGKITNVKEFETKYPSFELFHSDIKNSALKTAANKLLDRNNTKSLRNQTVKDFLIKNLKFEEDYLDKSILNPEATASKLSNVKAMDFLRTFGYSSDEVNEKALRAFVNNNMDKNKVKFNADEKKFVTRAGESLISEEVKNSETITMKHLFKVLNIENGFGNNKQLLNTNMDNFLLWLNKNMDIKTAAESATTKGSNLKKLASAEFLESHAKEIAKSAASKAKANYGAFGKIQGIVLSLATLPFACGVLNWSYPRIMEKCFPHLTSAKKQHSVDDKGGK